MTRHAEVAAAGLEHEWCRELCACFARTLTQERPRDLRLERRFAAQLPLFERLDTCFSTAAEITGTALLENFRVDELRRHLVGTRFVLKQLGVAVPGAARDHQVETGRIAAVLTRCRRERWGELVASFDRWLSGREVALRTRRLYLVAAERFARATKTTRDGPATESALLRYLRGHRGARANLFSLVDYLRTELKWNLRMPPKSALGASARMPRPVTTVARVVAEIDRLGLSSTPTASLRRLIATALGFRQQQLDEPGWRLEERDGDAVLHFNDEAIDLPRPLIEPAREWLRRTTPSSAT